MASCRVIACIWMLLGSLVVALAATEPAGSYISCINDAQSQTQQTVYSDFVSGKPVR